MAGTKWRRDVLLGIARAVSIFLCAGCCLQACKRSDEILTFKVSFYCDVINKQPMAGVIVFVSEPQTGDLILSATTDSAGQVVIGSNDFPEATESFTLSVAYVLHNVRRIESISGCKAQDMVFYGDYYHDSLIEGGVIDIQLTDVPPGCSYTVTSPVYSYDSGSAGFHDDVEVSHWDIQGDGSITILGKSYDQAYVLERYGFIVDQAFADGGSYTVPLSYAPQTFTFVSDTQIDDVCVYACRRHVWTDIGDSYSAAVEGSVDFCGQFPLLSSTEDYYEVSFERYEDLSETEDRWTEYCLQYATVPSSITVEGYPGFQIDSFTLDAANRQAEWTVSGAAALDVAYVDLYGSGSDHATEWFVSTDVSTTRAAIPELPLEIATWLDLGTVEECAVRCCDFDTLSGYEDYLAAVSGDDVAEARTVFMASYDRHATYAASVSGPREARTPGRPTILSSH